MRPPRPQIRQVGGGNSPEEWFKSLPPITRAYLIAAFFSTIFSHFGIVSPRKLIWDWEGLKNFQLWRLITPFTFFGGLGMPFVMQLFMLVQYSSRYEISPFNTGGGGGSSDYAMMLIFGAGALHILNLYMGKMVLGSCLVMMITYVWSCREPHSMVSFWGFTLEAMYLPWALTALQFLMNGQQGLSDPLMGIAVGHVYFFLIDTLPVEYDWDVLKTPNFLVDAFEGPPVGPGGGGGGGGAMAGGVRVGAGGGVGGAGGAAGWTGGGCWGVSRKVEGLEAGGGEGGAMYTYDEKDGEEIRERGRAD
ncbi:derlin-like protein [Nannochloropsis oceanica]